MFAVHFEGLDCLTALQHRHHTLALSVDALAQFRFELTAVGLGRHD